MNPHWARHAPQLQGQDAQIVALHSAWQRSVGHSRNTVNDRRKLLRQLRHAVGVPLLEVTPEQLALWQHSISDKAVQSIAAYVGHAQGFYRWARRFKHRADDPAADVLQRPRLPRSVPNPIPDDMLKLALACAQPDMRAMLALMAFAGLRCAEVAGLCREDIRDRDDPPVIRVTGKGGHTRIVPAPAALLEALRAYGPPGSGPMFLAPGTGQPHTPAQVSQLVRRFLHGIGVPYSAHKLRHAYGTSAYRLSRDLLLTQKLMGHASPQTTQGYVEITDDAAAALGQQMDTRGRGLLGLPPDEDPPPAAVPTGAAEPPQDLSGLRLIQGGAA